MNTAREIILRHHKFTAWKRLQGGDADFNDDAELLVNAVRIADWADFTWGIVRGGLPSGLLRAGFDAVPEAGFHGVLAGMGTKLSPNSVKGRLAVLNIFQW